VFAEILEKCHIVTTPGSGFGPGGARAPAALLLGSTRGVHCCHAPPPPRRRRARTPWRPHSRPSLPWPRCAGEGFVRASAFGSRPNIMEAVKRFQAVYGQK